MGKFSGDPFLQPEIGPSQGLRKHGGFGKAETGNQKSVQEGSPGKTLHVRRNPAMAEQAIRRKAPTGSLERRFRKSPPTVIDAITEKIASERASGFDL
jgi:hypothetical protein